MKVGYLNAWAFYQEAEIMEYLSSIAPEMDVMFLSEILHNNNYALRIQLGDSWEGSLSSYRLAQQCFHHDYFTTSYHPNSAGVWTCHRTKETFPDTQFGNAVFIRRRHKVIASGSVSIQNCSDTESKRHMQWVLLEIDGVLYLIAHFHGIWLRGNTKGDAPERLQQSIRVVEELAAVVKKYQVEKIILGGDFNLDLDTVALRVIEGGCSASGLMLRNLIREHSITDTRTDLYREHGKAGKTMYADYVLASPTVEVHRFQVPHVPVSDHRPLILTCS